MFTFYVLVIVLGIGFYVTIAATGH